MLGIAKISGTEPICLIVDKDSHTVEAEFLFKTRKIIQRRAVCLTPSVPHL